MHVVELMERKNEFLAVYFRMVLVMSPKHFAGGL